MPESASRPGPSDVPAYDYTRSLTRRGWAWEFLRRNPAYCRDWSRSRAAATVERFGSIGAVVKLSIESPELANWGLLFRRRTEQQRDNGKHLLEPKTMPFHSPSHCPFRRPIV